MKKILVLLLVSALLIAGEPAWVKSAQDVHKNFRGQAGTVALIGDSITEDKYFWSTMKDGVLNADFDAESILKYIVPASWNRKGPKYGNCSGWQTIDALTVYEAVISRDNPEVAIIMLGTNDMQDEEYKLTDYERDITKIIRDFQHNGTITILSTLPPRQINMEGVERFNKVIEKIAETEKIPLIEFFAYIKGVNKKKPWALFKDGTHLTWGGKNDFSPEAMKENGVAVRNYVTLKKYYEVYQTVLSR